MHKIESILFSNKGILKALIRDFIFSVTSVTASVKALTYNELQALLGKGGFS